MKGETRDGLPEGIELVEHADSFEIIRTWFNARAVIIAVLAVALDGLLVFLWYLMLSDGSRISILFPLVHSLFAFIITYAAVAFLFNRTRAVVDAENIVISHEPVPWPGARKVATRNIKQLYTKDEERSSYGVVSYTYGLHAITEDGRNLTLLTNFANSEQVKYIEQKIERYLRIDDVPVRGEHKG